MEQKKEFYNLFLKRRQLSKLPLIFGRKVIFHSTKQQRAFSTLPVKNSPLHFFSLLNVEKMILWETLTIENSKKIANRFCIIKHKLRIGLFQVSAISIVQHELLHIYALKKVRDI